MRTAVAFWFLLATCSAQRARPDQNRADTASSNTPTTITTSVNLVMVPVVVRDHGRVGGPVSLLGKPDHSGTGKEFDLLCET
jgi:hypothetical protein